MPFINKFKTFTDSWWGFLITLAIVYGGVRGLQNYWGGQDFADTGLPKITLAEGLKRAQAENKFIVAELSATWCGTCRTMDRKVFSDPEVKRFLTDEVIYVRIDEKDADANEFAKAYDVRGYPTIMLLNPKGELNRFLPVTYKSGEFMSAAK